MKPLYDAWLVQIEVTNGCVNNCAHCTRGVRLVQKPFFADLGHIEKALQSLEGFKGGVGCMGGEPTIHPKFPEICALYRKYFPKKRIGILTAGGKKYEQYKDLILDTFGIINYNDHIIPSYHQPVFVASGEAVEDPVLREQLIDHCWLQRTWSPGISPRGAFFCEVAATLDLMFDGPGGYPIEKGWWNRDVEGFREQRDRYCRLCGVAVPLESFPDKNPVEVVSPANAERLRKAGVPANEMQIFDRKLTRDDIRENLRKRGVRDPSKYAVPDKNHFWARNSIEFYQKRKSFLHTLAAWWFEFKLKHF